jgi:hypothetical protein
VPLSGTKARPDDTLTIAAFGRPARWSVSALVSRTGPEQICDDRLLRVAEVAGPSQVLAAHYAGVVDQDIERRVLGGDAAGKSRDRLGIFDIERHRGHPVPAGDRLLERLLAAAGDDHRVSERVEAPGQFPADPGSAAGDENGIPCRFHH